ncbi:MAG: hypothetical protein Q4G46_14930 [Propionibacteriaceae bacterium]|nr:hypothetical protein [Propionibacteriaceae bacterium]
MKGLETTINSYRTVLVDQASLLGNASVELEATRGQLDRLQKEYSLRFSEGAANHEHEALTQELADASDEIARLSTALQESDRLRKKTQELYDRAKAERGEASGKVAELMLAIDELKAVPPTSPGEEIAGELAKTVAERDEARAALKRAETARKTAEQAEHEALAGLHKTEKQLAATVSALQDKGREAEELDRQLAKASGQLARLRESNLTLTEQTKRIPELEKELADARNLPARDVDLTKLRSNLAASAKWVEKDDPEKTARALAAALQELNRLEGK